MGKHRGALVLIVLMLCLVGGWWLLARDVDTAGISAQTVFAVRTPVEVHHVHTGRTHQYIGTTTISGGCATLASGISSTGENPPHVVLMLDTQAASDCPHNSASEQFPFNVSLEASAGEIPVFGGILSNGVPVSFTLVEDNP